MEFKVDENLPVEVADLLRQVGYDAVSLEPTCAFGAPLHRRFLHLSVVLLRGWSCKRRRGRLNSTFSLR
jgi:hypothetical protein